MNQLVPFTPIESLSREIAHEDKTDRRFKSQNMKDLMNALAFRKCSEVLVEIDRLQVPDSQKIAFLIEHKDNRHQIYAYHSKAMTEKGVTQKQIMAMAGVAAEVGASFKQKIGDSIHALMAHTEVDWNASNDMKREKTACDQLDQLLARLQRTSSSERIKGWFVKFVSMAGALAWDALKVIGKMTLKAVAAAGKAAFNVILWIASGPKTAILTMIALKGMKEAACRQLTHILVYKMSSTTMNKLMYNMSHRDARAIEAKKTKEAMQKARDDVWGTVGQTMRAEVMGGLMTKCIEGTGELMATSGVAAVTGALAAGVALPVIGTVAAGPALVTAVGASATFAIRGAFKMMAETKRIQTEQAVIVGDAQNAITMFVELVDPSECLQEYQRLIHGSSIPQQQVPVEVAD